MKPAMTLEPNICRVLFHLMGRLNSVPDDGGDWDADADDNREESACSVEVSCVSLCGECKCRRLG
jgi:hypothetical protein